jgi:hypothetical protein
MMEVNVDLVVKRLRENYDPNIEDRLINIYQLGSRVQYYKYLNF